MKNQLRTSNQTSLTTSEYLVTKDGEAYISQRELARLCGVEQSNINRFFASRNTDVNQGVVAENAILCITYYAFESKAANATARATLLKVTEAGMKAFIYHQAGYSLEAKPTFNIPKNYIEAMQLATNTLIEKEQLSLELSKAEELIEEYTPKVDDYEKLINSESTFPLVDTAKLVRIPPHKMNYTLRIDGFLTKENAPTSRSLNAGYMVANAYNFRDALGNFRSAVVAKVTPKGMIFFGKKYGCLAPEPSLRFQLSL